MRISDWSSDVCSSDLGPPQIRGDDQPRAAGSQHLRRRGSLPNAEFRQVGVELPLHATACVVVGLTVTQEKQSSYNREIGRASCRERVCQYVSISGVGVSLKNTKTHINKTKRQL